MWYLVTRLKKRRAAAKKGAAKKKKAPKKYVRGVFPRPFVPPNGDGSSTVGCSGTDNTAPAFGLILALVNLNNHKDAKCAV